MQFKQAKFMLSDDPKYKRCWKFDHVWSIIKNFEKFNDGDTSTRKVLNSYGFGDTIQSWKMLHLIPLHKNLQVCLHFL